MGPQCQSCRRKEHGGRGSCQNLGRHKLVGYNESVSSFLVFPVPIYPDVLLTPDVFNEALAQVPVREGRFEESKAIEYVFAAFSIRFQSVRISTTKRAPGKDWALFSHSTLGWEGFVWGGLTQGWVEGDEAAIDVARTALQERWETRHPGETPPEVPPEVQWKIERHSGEIARTLQMPWPETTRWTNAMVEVLHELGRAKKIQTDLEKALPAAIPGKSGLRL
jgi:hypothetical protein